MSKLSIRGTDKFGNGAFGARRDGGARPHNGVDIVTKDGRPFFSLNDGTVTKRGYTYKGSAIFRYVEVTHDNKAAWRYFYLCPAVDLGQKIKKGDYIGTTQSLDDKYPGITPHVHFEIIKNGEYIDPTEIVENE